MSIFDETLDDLLTRCGSFQDFDADRMREITATVLRERDSNAAPALEKLAKHWYDSLPNPDYSVYGHDDYIAEAWGCWIIYSRKYLRNICGANSLTDGRSIQGYLSYAKSVIDLGCGFGYTTAALCELFPDAKVTATNVPDTLQTKVASQVGKEYGFTVLPEVKKTNCDVIFASEYFEHIREPIKHLADVIELTAPRILITANAFGQRAIGHFISYDVGTQVVHGKQMNTVFRKAMSLLGYKQIRTRMWNQRPAVWSRISKPRFDILRKMIDRS